MRFREIGKTGIKISEIGFGCWTMGGPNWSLQNGQSIGWSEVNEDEVREGIRVGIEAGVNHWDNADIYGNGKAERMLAKCLRQLGVNRASQVIATKVGHFRGTAAYSYEPEFIRRQCEQSLRNLGTDYIDLYYFHHGTFVGPDYSGEAHDYLEEAAQTIHALKREGKIRAIGQSAYSEEDFERAVPVVKPDVLQNKANLRYSDFILPGCRTQRLMDTHGCSFVAFGPLDQGILLDKFDPENPPKFEEGEYRAHRKDFNPDTLRGVRARLGKLKERFGTSPTTTSTEESTALLASLACRWVLAHPHVCSVIPGFRNERQARCNVRAATDAPLTIEQTEFCRGVFAGA